MRYEGRRESLVPLETREIIVAGTPRSLQCKRGLGAWRAQVVDAARRQIPDESSSIQWADVAVQILHFCESWGDTDGDLDNIAKPILDALCDSQRVIFNDSQVKEILLRRVEWRRNKIHRIERASPKLTERLDRALRRDDPDDFVYIFVTTEFSLEHLP